MRYITMVEYSDSVAGNRSHSVIYPGFSRIGAITTLADGEHIDPSVHTKITVEDGTFTQSSRRIGYTGQHTDLKPQGKHTVEQVPGGCIITSDSPYIEISGYVRNRYGGKQFRARLDCEALSLERPVTRVVGDTTITNWYKFTPSNYHD